MTLKSGLYEISYSGSSGVGSGTICVAEGRFAGFDVGGGNYVGDVDQVNGTGDFKGTLSFPQGGVLVSGQTVAAGSSMPISGRFALAGGQGGHFNVNVAGHEVRARITPIG